MKNYAPLNFRYLFLVIICTIFLASCTKSNDDTENVGPIVGKWFLTTINTINVANTDCYQDSFIESDAETITFYLLDLLENGDCETVVNNTSTLTIQDDFYYLGDEALEIYINGNTLEWRIDTNNSMEFQR